MGSGERRAHLCRILEGLPQANGGIGSCARHILGFFGLFGGSCGLTPRRIASQQRTQVPHSATGDSRKDALWGLTLTEKRTLHASGGCVERPFSPICVHSCVPTAARATGRGHGSHDIEGPMAPVMPGRSNLRSMPPGR